MMATPSKDQEASISPCSPAKFKVLPSDDTVKPRPSRTNSLLPDLLDFPLTMTDPNSDGLKCNFDSILDMGDEHDTPAGATHPIFQLPTGHEILLHQDVNTMKPEVLKEVETFPAVVVTNTTISASRLGSTTTPAVSESNVTRRGRTSQFSAKQRRERHNANERRRTNAAKDRVRDMRDTVTALGRQRAKLTVQRDAKAAADETLPHRRPVESVVLRERVEDYRIPGNTTYLDLVKSVDELRDEKQYLVEQLDQLDSQNSVLQAVQTELLIDATASLTAVGTKKILKRKRVEADEDIDSVSDRKRMALESCEIDTPAGGYCIEMEAIPSYLKVLFSEPMTSDAAFNWVKDSYGDIMALKSQQKPQGVAVSTVLGWCEDKREVTKKPMGTDDEYSIEMMLTQDFPNVVSAELVFNTWNLLTILDAFRKLYPLTKDLAILQTINDDCVIVRVGIAPFRDAPVVHSIIVLARGQIDGGYLISMRSVPLSPGQQAFAADEACYLPVLAWFMLLDKHDEFAQPVCEVIVGASTKHKSEQVLNRLSTEFIAGLVRWQDAVCQRKQWLL